MSYTVYCHTNRINGKKYIGITNQPVQSRWREGGKGYSNQNKFFNAIKKYGWDNFHHEILYEGLSENDACNMEKFLIKYYNTIDKGYNVQPGGNITHHSNQTKEKIKNSHLGIKRTPETIKKMTETKIEKYGIPVICIETNKRYSSLGEASRATNIDKSSISRCCKGEQGIAGGYHWQYLNKENFSYSTDKRKKRVICLNTGIIYNSVQEAAKATQSDASNISKVCNGKYKTTNKLKWEWYIDD